MINAQRQVHPIRYVNGADSAPMADIRMPTDHAPRWYQRLFTLRSITMSGKEVKVLTSTQLITILLFIASAIGGMYYRLDSTARQTQLDFAAYTSAQVEKEKKNKEDFTRLDRQNRINYELYREIGGDVKQTLGYLQGLSGKKPNIVLPEIPPTPPPAETDQ
jgi:hypothetical protein